jgi:hypothetical protein
MSAMNRTSHQTHLIRLREHALRIVLCVAVACGCLVSPVTRAAQTGPEATSTAARQQETFSTPEAAAEALVAAAERFDVPAMVAILGPEGDDLVVTGDPVQDRNQSADFAAQARAKSKVVRDDKNPKVATLIVGSEDWPMPIPIVEQGGHWRFDTAAGRTEILYRRIGRNELDAIEACRNYVAAQNDYALQKHDGSQLNQYAQRVISTPGKQDGLVWRTENGTLQGPLASGLAEALAEGYTNRTEPVHGYYFKILKGQGPAAPLGEMEYLVKGAMIGGFALVAAPAEYEVTGVKSFIVSQDGVVYEKDLGSTTLDQFRAMERFNPDSTWDPVEVP